MIARRSQWEEGCTIIQVEFKVQEVAQPDLDGMDREEELACERIVGNKSLDVAGWSKILA